MASSTSPFTYGAVEVIFGSIYFYFHLQTAPDLQDCPHSTNLPTIPESTLSKKAAIKLSGGDILPRYGDTRDTAPMVGIGQVSPADMSAMLGHSPLDMSAMLADV